MSCLGVTCGLSMFIIQPGHMEKLYVYHGCIPGIRSASRVPRSSCKVSCVPCTAAASWYDAPCGHCGTDEWQTCGTLIVVTPEKDRTVKSTQDHSNWLFYLFWGFLIVFFWVSRVVLVGHSEVTSQMWKFCVCWKTWFLVGSVATSSLQNGGIYRN